MEWLSGLNTEYHPAKSYRRSSIICTIGPKTNSPEKINMLRKGSFPYYQVSEINSNKCYSWRQCCPYELLPWITRGTALLLTLVLGGTMLEFLPPQRYSSTMELIMWVECSITSLLSTMLEKLSASRRVVLWLLLLIRYAPLRKDERDIIADEQSKRQKGPEIRTGNTPGEDDIPIAAGKELSISTDDKYATASDDKNM